jgi:hypothetical protein
MIDALRCEGTHFTGRILPTSAIRYPVFALLVAWPVDLKDSVGSHFAASANNLLQELTAALMAQALTKTSTLGLLDWAAESARDSVRFDIALVRPWLDSAGHVSKPNFKRTPLPLLSVGAP